MHELMVSAAKMSVFFCLLFFVGACSPASVTMDSTFQNLSAHAAPVEKCNIDIDYLEDHRRDKDSLGALAYTEVFSVDPLLWVENGFKSFGLMKELIDQTSDHRRSVQVSLKVAHISNLLSAKAANTVLGLSQDDFETVKYFRGSHASINWNSSSREIKSAFDISLTMAIESIIEYIDAECQTLLE